MFTPIGFFAPQGGGYVTQDLLWYVDANEVASYPGSGATLFDLVGSNDGTISGPTFTTSGGVSYFNYTGINDEIEFASLTNIDSTEWTVQFWAWNNASTTTNYNGIVFVQKAPLGGMGIHIANETGGTRSPSTSYWFGSVGVGVGSPNTEVYSTGTYNKQEWVFITVRQQISGNNGNINFSFNNTIDATYKSGGPYYRSFASRVQYLGWWAANNNENLGHLDGRIGNCLVYNRLLTDQEISDNFDYQKALYGY